MSVNIDYDGVTNENKKSVSEKIVNDILNTIPAYIKTYSINNVGFYSYLKNIVAYILGPLEVIFDLQLNLFNTDYLANQQPNYDTITKKDIICAQKICDNVGIVNTGVSGFITYNTDGTINEENTLKLQLDYLRALYAGSILNRVYNSTYDNYSKLLSRVLPDANAIQIQDEALLEKNNNKMSINSNIDAYTSTIFKFINRDILKSLITPNLLGVSTGVTLADVTTMYWDGKDVNNNGIDDYLDDNKVSTEEEYALWDERRWVGEY